MLTKKELGKKISRLRFDKFGSLRNAAEYFGCTHQKLSMLEHARMKHVDVYWLSEIANGFGLTLYELLEEEKTHE